MSRARRVMFKRSGSYDTSASAAVDIELASIDRAGAMVEIKQVFIQPEVVGTSATSYQAAISAGVITALTDTDIRYLSTATTVAAGSAPRPVTEWTMKYPGSGDVIATLALMASPTRGSDGSLHLRLEFDAGTGHSGLYEVIGEIILGG